MSGSRQTSAGRSDSKPTRFTRTEAVRCPNGHIVLDTVPADYSPEPNAAGNYTHTRFFRCECGAKTKLRSDVPAPDGWTRAEMEWFELTVEYTDRTSQHLEVLAVDRTHAIRVACQQPEVNDHNVQQMRTRPVDGFDFAMQRVLHGAAVGITAAGDRITEDDIQKKERDYMSSPMYRIV